LFKSSGTFLAFPKATALLKLALQALQKACQQPGTEHFSREKILSDPDLRLLRTHFPEQWKHMFQQP